MFVISSFFSILIFLMSPQIVCLQWCKVAKITFQRVFFRVISNVYTNALLETMLNQNSFICAKNLQIKFANITSFDRPEEIHCTTVVGCCIFTQSSSFIIFAKRCIVSSCIIAVLEGERKVLLLFAKWSKRTIEMQEVCILPLKKPGSRHLSRLSKKQTYALRGNISEWSQDWRKPAN